MSVVQEVGQASLDRRVAVKVLPPSRELALVPRSSSFYHPTDKRPRPARGALARGWTVRVDALTPDEEQEPLNDTTRGSRDAQELLACETRDQRQRLMARFFETNRSRLRFMVQLRLHPRLRRRLDPSDVLQEVCLEASRRLDEFLETRGFPVFVWLRRLTAQKLFDLHAFHLGAQARDARREVSLDREGPPVSSATLIGHLSAQGCSPSEAVLREETRVRVEGALDSMDPLDREVLILRHFECLSNAEVAVVLGIHEDAASKRHARALRRLKDILAMMSGDAK